MTSCRADRVVTPSILVYGGVFYRCPLTASEVASVGGISWLARKVPPGMLESGRIVANKHKAGQCQACFVLLSLYMCAIFLINKGVVGIIVPSVISLWTGS